MKQEWRKNRITSWKKEELNRFIEDIGLFQYERESEERSERARFFVGEAYAFLSSKEKVIELMGSELMKTIIGCVNNFDPEKGDFSNYLNASIKNAKNTYYNKEANIERSLHISAAKQKLAKKIVSYLDERELPYLSKDMAKELALKFGVKEKEILKAYQSHFIVADSSFVDKDEEETEIDIPCEDKNILSVASEELLDLFCDILEKDLEKHPKRRDLYAIIITNWTCEAIFNDLKIKKIPWITVLRKHDLYHKGVYSLCYKRSQNGKNPSLQGQELAKILKKDNAIVSRAQNEIRSMLAEALKKE